MKTSNTDNYISQAEAAGEIGRTKETARVKARRAGKLRRLALMAVLVMVMPVMSACGKRSRQERELREFAIELMNEGAYGAAIAKFDEALSMNDGRVGEVEIDILKYRAQAEMLMGDYAAAEYTYTLLEREDGKSDEYTNLRIVCMARSGSDLDRAIELYEKAESENPYAAGHTQALYVLGEVLSSSELTSRRESAKSFYEAALADDKRRSAQLYDRLGMMLFSEGDIEGALEQFENGKELIESGESYADEDAQQSIMFNIAVCMEHQAKWEQALEMFKAYEEAYGTTEQSSHEIAFIEGILSEKANAQ